MTQQQSEHLVTTITDTIFTPKDLANLSFGNVDLSPLCKSYVRLAILKTIQALDEERLARLKETQGD